MKITICAGCNEVKQVYATMYPEQAICYECAEVYGINRPKMCTVCKTQQAMYEPEQQPVHSAHHTYVCEDCADKRDIDLENGWCVISEY